MPASLSFLGSLASGADSSSYTTGSLDFGAEAADRLIIATIAARFAAVTPSIAVTIGGVAATQVAQRVETASGASYSLLYAALVPAGASGTVGVVFGSNATRCGIAAFRATGVKAAAVATATDGNTATPAGSLTIARPGIIVAGVYNGGSVGSNQNHRASAAMASVAAGTHAVSASLSSAGATWTGLTEQTDAVLETLISAPHALAAAAWEELAPISGTGAATLAPLNTVSASRLELRAGVAGVLGALVGAATAKLRIRGNAAATFAPLVGAASSSLPVEGDAGGTLLPLVGGATGVLPIRAESAASLAPLVTVAAGDLPILGAAGGLLQRLVAAAAATLGLRVRRPVPPSRSALAKAELRSVIATAERRDAIVPAALRRAIATREDSRPMNWPPKDPADVLDYEIRWKAALDGDTIATSSWQVPAGITSNSNDKTADRTSIWLSGGTAGQKYQLVNTITTAAGRTIQRTISIEIRQR